VRALAALEGLATGCDLVLGEDLPQHPKPRRQVSPLVPAEIADHLTEQLRLCSSQVEGRVERQGRRCRQFFGKRNQLRKVGFDEFAQVFL
jgi:hypothetical protein